MGSESQSKYDIDILGQGNSFTMLLIGNKILVKVGKNGESRHENMLSCPVVKKKYSGFYGRTQEWSNG